MFALEFRTAADSSGWNAISLYDAFCHGLATEVKDVLATHEPPDAPGTPVCIKPPTRQPKRRQANGLCLYCGEARHIAVSCPVKGRAHPLKEESAPDSSKLLNWTTTTEGLHYYQWPGSKVSHVCGQSTSRFTTLWCYINTQVTYLSCQMISLFCCQVILPLDILLLLSLLGWISDCLFMPCLDYPVQIYCLGLFLCNDLCCLSCSPWFLSPVTLGSDFFLFCDFCCCVPHLCHGILCWSLLGICYCLHSCLCSFFLHLKTLYLGPVASRTWVQNPCLLTY